MKRAVVISAAAALVYPATAGAHGISAPVATDWEATVETAPPGVDARVVDGDRQLWLRVRRPLVVEIAGILGEPVLRFTRSGVWVNVNSPTAASDGIRRGAGASPEAAPRWQRLTASDSYRWHEHRLHALEVVGGGRWTVPLLVAGRRTRVAGVLRRLPRGTYWPWLVVAAAGAVAGIVLRVGILVPSVLALAAAGALRIGHALQGRPDVVWPAYVDCGLSFMLVMVLLATLVLTRRPEARGFAALAVGAVTASQALVMVPVLVDAHALSALGTTAARTCIVLALAAGTAAGAAGFRALIREVSIAP